MEGVVSISLGLGLGFIKYYNFSLCTRGTYWSSDGWLPLVANVHNKWICWVHLKRGALTPNNIVMICSRHFATDKGIFGAKLSKMSSFAELVHHLM